MCVRVEGEAFAARLRHERPAGAAFNMPPPLGIMSRFVMLIGALIFLLALVPHTVAPWVITLLGALVLLGAGALLFRASRRLAALPTAR